MSAEEHPRPQYGEYASESEWARAIERSGATVPEKQPAKQPEKRPDATARESRSVPQPALRQSKSNTATVDRLATIFLLSFGLVSVIGGAGDFLDFAATINRMFDQLGIGEYTPTSLTPIMGILIVTSQGAIWLAAAIWSFLRLRRRRVSFWIPLMGGAVNFLVVALMLSVLLSTDPAFLAFTGEA